MLERKEKTMEKVSMNKLEMARRAAKGGSGGTLTPATSETLGGVKIGEGVNVSEDGTISVPSYTPPAYSTDEVETGKLWIDGKIVYRKVISYDSPVSITPNNYPTIIADASGYKQFIKADALASSGGVIDVDIFIESGAVKMHTFDTFLMSGIIIEYTKAGV